MIQAFETAIDINSLVALNENKIMMIYNSIYGAIYNINGYEVFDTIPVQLNVPDNINDTISMFALDESTVLVVRGAHIWASIYKIEETEIINQSDILLSNETVNENCLAVCRLIDNQIAVIYNRVSNGNTYGFVIDYLNKFIKTVTKRTERITGVALKNGVEGQMVPIAVPIYEEE